MLSGYSQLASLVPTWKSCQRYFHSQCPWNLGRLEKNATSFITRDKLELALSQILHMGWQHAFRKLCRAQAAELNIKLHCSGQHSFQRVSQVSTINVCEVTTRLTYVCECGHCITQENLFDIFQKKGRTWILFAEALQT